MSKLRSNPENESAPSSKIRRPRLLYFIVAYPNFSETYMHEEIRSLWNEYDIRIITYRTDSVPRRMSFPYKLIPYKAPCLVYGKIEAINQEFTSPNQQDFFNSVSAEIEEFKPDILHAHYFGFVVLLRILSEKYKIPFTVRTHSMDILSEPRAKLEAFCTAANSSWCLRLLAFPENRIRLIEIGINPEKVTACWPVVNYARFYKPEPRPPTRRVMCAGPAIPKKAHNELVDLAEMMKGSGYSFDLYAAGPALKPAQVYNESKGNLVNTTYVDPDDMPSVYPRYDWLVYPSDRKINKVGLPVAIAEAQASGLGVCWQELPGRRQEQLDYLGGAGFLFNSIAEVPAILQRPYPVEMRLRGYEAAKRADIADHKRILTETWESALAQKRRSA